MLVLTADCADVLTLSVGVNASKPNETWNFSDFGLQDL